MIGLTAEEHRSLRLAGEIGRVKAELHRAAAEFAPFAGGHEALAVIEEEFLELRSAIFWGVDQRGQPADARVEATQLAAMCLRFLVDL